MSKEQKQLTDGSIEQATALAKSGSFTLDMYFGQKLDSMEAEVWDEFEDVDDMEEIIPRLPQIGIAHSAQMFKMPDDSKCEALTGIIIDNNPCKAYWEITFDESGGGTPPDCSALDGIRPDAGVAHKQADLCALCEKNQFGSDGGRGKACKNMRRLHLALPGSALPHRLTLSPANLKPFNEFVTVDVRGKRLKLLGVLTKMSLISARNQDNIEYSEVKFSVVKDDLGKPVVLAKTREQAKALKSYRDSWIGAMRGQEILSNEHASHSDEGDSDKYEVYDVPTHAGPVKETQDPVEDAPPFDDDDQDDLF